MNEQFEKWWESAPYIPGLSKVDCYKLWQAATLAERERCAQVVESRLEYYPVEVFTEPPNGQHGETIDACSARAIRNFIPSLSKEIREGGA